MFYFRVDLFAFKIRGSLVVKRLAETCIEVWLSCGYALVLRFVHAGLGGVVVRFNRFAVAAVPSERCEFSVLAFSLFKSFGQSHRL